MMLFLKSAKWFLSALRGRHSKVQLADLQVLLEINVYVDGGLCISNTFVMPNSNLGSGIGAIVSDTCASIRLDSLGGQKYRWSTRPCVDIIPELGSKWTKGCTEGPYWVDISEELLARRCQRVK